MLSFHCYNNLYYTQLQYLYIRWTSESGLHSTNWKALNSSAFRWIHDPSNKYKIATNVQQDHGPHLILAISQPPTNKYTNNHPSNILCPLQFECCQKKENQRGWVIRSNLACLIYYCRHLSSLSYGSLLHLKSIPMDIDDVFTYHPV
jgi:hypothetical protein